VLLLGRLENDRTNQLSTELHSRLFSPFNTVSDKAVEGTYRGRQFILNNQTFGNKFFACAYFITLHYLKKNV
jgi:hypothetical protein